MAAASGRLLANSTTFGTGRLSIGTPSLLNATSIFHRSTHCKDDDDPSRFMSSRNITFPVTPSLSDHPDDPEVVSFDCFLDLPPGGVVQFEIKGDISSHLSLEFEVYVIVAYFHYTIGVYRCDLLDLDKDPCAFDINQRFIKGQGGLYPKQDQDPNYEDLCVELHVQVKAPFKKQVSINFEKCFYKFPKSSVEGKGSGI